MASCKITFIGAGSTVFARHLIGDILSFAELVDVDIVLYDIDASRLCESLAVGQKIKEQLGVPARITTTTDRRAALDGADFVINMIQVAGYKPGTVIDFETPRKFGLRQTIADTLGIGGIMRALRTIPVLSEICKEMERLCPDGLYINHTNPMAMNCWGLSRLSKIKTVGLCHSVPYTAQELAVDIGVPVEEIDYLVAGINHMAFYLKFTRNGEDLNPLIRKVVEEGRVPDRNRVRYDIFTRLGYFVTESSEHFAEYVPWYIRSGRQDLIERYNIPLDEYLHRCEKQIAEWKALSVELQDQDKKIPIKRSVEYTSHIIHAMVTGKPAAIYGNVSNDDIISNLPDGCCVEVPCLVDRNGIQPIRIGAIPPHLAALMQTNINVQALTVEAIVTGRKEHIYHAAMLDPHTSAELDLDQIWVLVDDMLKAHGDWIPEILR